MAPPELWAQLVCTCRALKPACNFYATRTFVMLYLMDLLGGTVYIVMHHHACGESTPQLCTNDTIRVQPPFSRRSPHIFEKGLTWKWRKKTIIGQDRGHFVLLDSILSTFTTSHYIIMTNSNNQTEAFLQCVDKKHVFSDAAILSFRFKITFCNSRPGNIIQKGKDISLSLTWW